MNRPHENLYNVRHAANARITCILAEKEKRVPVGKRFLVLHKETFDANYQRRIDLSNFVLVSEFYMRPLRHKLSTETFVSFFKM